MGITTLKYKDGTYVFTTQGSTTFLFRVADGMGDYVDYNPLDYTPQLSPVRGNRKETVGGSAIVQQFSTGSKVKFDCDKVISFSMFLTQAEIEDLDTAFANPGRWELTDYLGHTYYVTLDNQEGFTWDSKIKANDRILARFKFWIQTVVS